MLHFCCALKRSLVAVPGDNTFLGFHIIGFLDSRCVSGKDWRYVERLVLESV